MFNRSWFRVWKKNEKKKRREEMKRHSLWIFALIVAMAFGIGAASAQEVSVGYQGLIGQGTNYLNGLSVRGWTDQIGYQGAIFYGQAGVDTPLGDVDADLWVLNGQVMYAPIVKENSKFYVGLDLGYGGWEVDPSTSPSMDDNFWMVGPLLGAEYNLPGLPELGFNWEVSYEFLNVDVDDANTDIDLSGINVTAGVHYKF
jgi:hypothetical protein